MIDLYPLWMGPSGDGSGVPVEVIRYVAIDAASIDLPQEPGMELAADSDLELLADDSVDVDSDGTLVVSDGDELEID